MSQGEDHKCFIDFKILKNSGFKNLAKFSKFSLNFSILKKYFHFYEFLFWTLFQYLKI